MNTADLVLVVIDKLEDYEKVIPLLKKVYGKIICAITKSDLLSENEKRKLNATIRSKKIPAVLLSNFSSEEMDNLKEKILENSDSIRVYTKEPNKPSTKDPILLPPKSTVRDVAEKILKGFSQKIKEARVTGPSGKFPNQKVGISHVLKDLDIVEFKTK
jgi:ribosome-interacting GTPase 1